jgi:hypothetical protein
MSTPYDLLLHHMRMADQPSPWTAVLFHDALESIAYQPPQDIESWVSNDLQNLKPMIQMSSVGNLGFFMGDFSAFLRRPYHITIPAALHPNKKQTSSTLVGKIRSALSWPTEQPDFADPGCRIGTSKVIEFGNRKAVSLIVRDGSKPPIRDLDAALLSVPPMRMTHLVLPFTANDDLDAWVAGLVAWAQRPVRMQGGAMFLTVCWVPDSKSHVLALQEQLSTAQTRFYVHGSF